ncbi:MAG: NAD-dependent succinate-semialdehyde dehydrogenase [Acidimicrobiales bacterium]
MPVTAEQEGAVITGTAKQLLVDGAWRSASSGRTFPVEDPSTGRVLCEVADADSGDALDALAAAAEHQPAWSAQAPRERGEILYRAYQLLTARIDELALLMTLEMGKPLAESRGEIAYAAEFLRWFSEEAVRIDGGYAVAPNGQGRLLVMRQPVGPSLLITPWNFPMAMGTRKIGPAVTAGCTMVVKPAEQTPLSMLALAAILDEAGLPPGVLNLVTTSQAAELVGPILADPRLRKLSFTGSSEVGQQLIAGAAPQVLRVSMELGGNAPFLVFEDADLDAAVSAAVQAKMRNIGEACTAANRFYVAGSVCEEFAQRLAARLGAMRIGRGTEDGVEVGPLIDEAGRDKVVELVEDAVVRGAEVVLGGHPSDGPGHFYPPTVVTHVPAGARILQEEIFGPVAPITTISNEAEAVAAANGTRFGLVAYVFTSDLDRAVRVAEALETGMVGLNQGIVSTPAAPFGGIKHSGLGREGGREGIHEFLNVKYVAVHVPGSIP